MALITILPTHSTGMLFSCCMGSTLCHIFTLRCEHGVLVTCFGKGDLEMYSRTVALSVEGWENERVLSLHEAARPTNPLNEFHDGTCKCGAQCRTSNVPTGRKELFVPQSVMEVGSAPTQTPHPQSLTLKLSNTICISQVLQLRFSSSSIPAKSNTATSSPLSTFYRRAQTQTLLHHQPS